MIRSMLHASLALLLLCGQAAATEAYDAPATGREGCFASGVEAATCSARAEIEDAARCALANMRTASADSEDAVPNPFRVISDRKEALRLLSEGERSEAMVIAEGTRTLAGAACGR